MSRKLFRTAILTAALVLCASFIGGASADDKTWTGTISDSKCGAKHMTTAEHPGEKMPAAECAAACVKGGAKYVFVAGEKVYAIDNQDFGELAANIGRSVKLSGTMNGDTITVTKVEPGGDSQH